MQKWAPQSKQPAFTIVELLIVIVVIAILAAITIVAYTGIQNRAKASAISSAASQAGKQALAYAPTNNDLYPTEAQFQTSSFRTTTLKLPTDTPQATYDYYASDDQKSFCLSVTDTTTSPETAYAMTQNGATVNGRCVRNLVDNPSFEISAAGWGASSSVAGTSTAWSVAGNRGLTITPNSSSNSDSYVSKPVYIGTGKGELVSGQEYTASASFYETSPQTGTLENNGRTRRIVGYSWASTTPANLGMGTMAPNVANSVFRSKINFSITQASAERLDLRLYNGASNTSANIVYWDAAMLTKGPTQYQYGDGDSPNWSWNTVAHGSTSFGPAIPEN